MKRPKSLFLVLFVFAFHFICSCQNSASKILWKSDLIQFKKILYDKHINPYTYISKVQLDKRFDSLDKRIDNLTDEQVKVALLEIIATIGDSHTNAVIPAESLFPFSFSFFDDGVYVTLSGKEYSNCLGKKLTAIDNMGIDQINRLMLKIIPHENLSHFKAILTEYLVRPDILKGLGITGSGETATFHFEGSANQPISFSVPAIRSQDLGNYYRTMIPFIPARPLLSAEVKGRPYWFRVIANNTAMYLNYNRCAESSDYPFNEFTSDFFRCYDSIRPAKVIIDIRSNAGGNSGLFMPFAEELAKRQESLHEGTLFVLTGIRTFSSAIINAVWLRKNTNALFIGDSTGGKPNHFGETETEKLQSSNILVKYSTRIFQIVDDDPPSFEPDIYVRSTFSDYSSGEDPVILAALNHQTD